MNIGLTGALFAFELGLLILNSHGASDIKLILSMLIDIINVNWRIPISFK